jgi:predicted permease
VCSVFEIVTAVVCAAVPTAKTVFILAGEYKVEEDLVTTTGSITMLLSVGWLSKHESGTGGCSEDFKKL